MGIVTRDTVFNDAFAGPVGNSFAVGAANPVFLLSEMTLAAHLVAVIHVDLNFRFGYQVITFVFFVTGIAGHLLYLTGVIQADFTMGHFSGLRNIYGLIFVTLTAFEALHLVLAGFRPEGSALVWPGHLNDIGRKYGYDIDFFSIIEGRICIFISLRYAALIAICDPC